MTATCTEKPPVFCNSLLQLLVVILDVSGKLDSLLYLKKMTGAEIQLLTKNVTNKQAFFLARKSKLLTTITY